MQRSWHKKKLSYIDAYNTTVKKGGGAHEYNSMEAKIFSKCYETKTFIVSRISAVPSFIKFRVCTKQLEDIIYSDTLTEGDRVIVIYKIEYAIPISVTPQNLCGFICAEISLVN
ncbi:TPA: hypothetical protein PGG59_005159 [Raoultella planticola]|nr:hypothetical protein [Raoultella planticola]